MGIARWLRRLGILVVVVYAATFAYVVIFAATFENPETPPRVDVIVCLGGGAYDDGRLARSSAGRAVTCAEVFANGAAPKVLFTGANRNSSVESTARAMADLAEQHGLPASAVVLEEVSRSTLQNALFSAPQLENAKSILVVTQGFHLKRSEISFGVMGPWEVSLWMSEPFDLHADGSIRWKPIHREVLAYWFNLGRYLVWKAGNLLGMSNIDAILA